MGIDRAGCSRPGAQVKSVQKSRDAILVTLHRVRGHFTRARRLGSLSPQARRFLADLEHCIDRFEMSEAREQQGKRGRK